MAQTRVIKLDPKSPDLEELRVVGGELLRGKIVAFPTETVYGLAACAHVPGAVRRLYELKKRDPKKPFAYHIPSLDSLERLHVIQSRVFRFLIHQFWPGPVTFIALNRKDEKVGLRMPKHAIAQNLLAHCTEPVVATSANEAVQTSAKTAEEVLNRFRDQIDILIDGGKCEWGQDSTVVDVIQMPPKIVRRGVFCQEVESAIRKIELGKFPRKKILIVCTGNICRSPMAEMWLKSELKRKGLSEQIEVSSCGICAREGLSPSTEAVLTLKNDEMSVEDFRSHLCKREDAMLADLILAMGEEHERYISGLYPPAKDRIVTLGIEDPIGMTVDMYQKCYESIQEKLSEIWPEIVRIGAG